MSTTNWGIVPNNNMKDKRKMANKDIPKDYTKDKFFKDLDKICKKIKPEKFLKCKKSSGKT